MAKTSAERQADYRARRNGGEGDRRLNTWVSTISHFALERLSKHHNLTKRELLENLISSADNIMLNDVEGGREVRKAVLRSNTARQKSPDPHSETSSDEIISYAVTKQPVNNQQSYAVTNEVRNKKDSHAVTVSEQLQLF